MQVSQLISWLVRCLVCGTLVKAHWHTHAGFDHEDYDFEQPEPTLELQCPRQPVPFKTELSKYSLYYPFLDKGLSIFTDLQIGCNGYLLEWHFLSAVTVVWGLHLAVFRQFAHNTDEFALIHETYVNGMTTRSFGDTWAILKLQRPLKVRAGDFVGAFYDKNVTLAYGALSLRSMGRQMNQPEDMQLAPTFDLNKTPYRPNTLLFSHTAEDLRASNGVINRKDAFMVERLPGLYIMLGSVEGEQELKAIKPMVNRTQTMSEPMLVPKKEYFRVTPRHRTSTRSNSPRNSVKWLGRQQQDHIVVVPGESRRRGRTTTALRSKTKPTMAVVPKVTPFFEDTTPKPRRTRPTQAPRRRSTAALPATLAPFPAHERRFALPKISFEAEVMPTAAPSRCHATPVYFNCDKLMIRFYYDTGADVCRQYLTCAKIREAENFGFPSHAACMLACAAKAPEPMLNAFVREPVPAIEEPVETMPPKTTTTTTSTTTSTTTTMRPRTSSFLIPRFEGYRNLPNYEDMRGGGPEPASIEEYDLGDYMGYDDYEPWVDQYIRRERRPLSKVFPRPGLSRRPQSKIFPQRQRVARVPVRKSDVQMMNQAHRKHPAHQRLRHENPPPRPQPSNTRRFHSTTSNRRPPPMPFNSPQRHRTVLQHRAPVTFHQTRVPPPPPRYREPHSYEYEPDPEIEPVDYYEEESEEFEERAREDDGAGIGQFITPFFPFRRH